MLVLAVRDRTFPQHFPYLKKEVVRGLEDSTSGADVPSVDRQVWPAGVGIRSGHRLPSPLSLSPSPSLSLRFIPRPSQDKSWSGIPKLPHSLPVTATAVIRCGWIRVPSSYRSTIDRHNAVHTCFACLACAVRSCTTNKWASVQAAHSEPCAITEPRSSSWPASKDSKTGPVTSRSHQRPSGFVVRPVQRRSATSLKASYPPLSSQRIDLLKATFLTGTIPNGLLHTMLLNAHLTGAAVPPSV